MSGLSRNRTEPTVGALAASRRCCQSVPILCRFRLPVGEVLVLPPPPGAGAVPCGFITGATKPGSEFGESDMRRFDPRWHPSKFEQSVAAVAQRSELAPGKRATLAQLALALIFHYVVAIPGSRSRTPVEDNVAGADLAFKGAVRMSD